MQTTFEVALWMEVLVQAVEKGQWQSMPPQMPSPQQPKGRTLLARGKTDVFSSRAT
jgi:hypothetical protein